MENGTRMARGEARDSPIPTLDPYQVRGVNQILTYKSVFLMADVGMGKTAIALTAKAKVKGPALVVAPLNVCYNTWPDEIDKWAPHLTYTILHGKGKDAKLRYKRDIYIVNYEGLKWFFFACVNKEFRPRKMFIILDESSFIKSHDTQRFTLFKKLKPLFSSYRVCLSATPSSNGLHQLWPQYYVLDGGRRLGRKYHSFRARHFTYSGPPRFDTSILPGQQEVIENKVKDITFRLDDRDYIKLPKYIYNFIKIDPTPKVKAFYEKYEKEFLAQFEGDPAAALSSSGLSNKLRQITQGGIYLDEGGYEPLHNIKLVALRSLMEGVAGNPILCAVHFKFELDMIKKEFGDVPAIVGGVATSKTKMWLRQWNSGQLPLLVCHPASLGHGVNIQAGGHVVLWYTPTWSLEHYIQLNGRLRRRGQKAKGVVINHLILKGTIDEAIMGALRMKNLSQTSFLQAMREYCNRRLKR